MENKRNFGEKILRNLTNPFKQLERMLKWISPFIKNDEVYLSFMYFIRTRKILHLKNPKTFGDKIQWLKLNYRLPIMTTMVDKFAVKEYVTKIIGAEYIIPTIGVWDNPIDIDWNSLPNQFVLKTTHGGGGLDVVICKNKSLLDKKYVISRLEKSLTKDIYSKLREWPYRDVPHRIIAEEYLTENDGNLKDYKFFCFNGEPEYCQVISDRRSNMTIDFFDMKWNHQPFREPRNYPMSQEIIYAPKNLDEMIVLSKKLSSGLPFVRVDFYEVNKRTLFGELTLYPTSGMGLFDPEEWDVKFGEMIQLPIA